MNLWQEYKRPASIPEALDAFRSAPGSALFIAGGTDVMLDLEQGNHPPVHTLVDLTFIPELKALEVQQDELFIGAGVPHSQVATSALVCEHARALAEACSLIGGPQVRNVGTLGGNVAHALPAADGTIALTALGAQAVLAGSQTCRRVPLAELFLGPGRSALDPARELLFGFYLRLRRPGQASAFRRVMRTQGIALPILNMAVWLQRKDDKIVEAQVSAGPSGPTPRRLAIAENALRGQAYAPGLVDSVLDALLSDAHFRTSPHRATAEYRRHLAGVLLRDALQAAWERAG